MNKKTKKQMSEQGYIIAPYEVVYKCDISKLFNSKDRRKMLRKYKNKVLNKSFYGTVKLNDL
jgi:hypothetical protein